MWAIKENFFKDIHRMCFYFWMGVPIYITVEIIKIMFPFFNYEGRNYLKNKKHSSFYCLLHPIDKTSIMVLLITSPAIAVNSERAPNVKMRKLG